MPNESDNAKRQESLELAQKELAIARQHLALSGDILEQKQHIVEVTKAELAVEKLKENLDLNKILQLERILDLQERSLSTTEKLETTAANIVERVTGIGGSWDNVLTSINDAGGAMKSLKGAVFSLTDGFRKALTPANIIGSTLEKIRDATIAPGIGMVWAFDQAQSQLNALSGAGGRYNSQLEEVAVANRKFGVGIAESGKAFGDLVTNMTGFTDEGPEMQNQLAGAVASLEVLGIYSLAFDMSVKLLIIQQFI